MCGICGKWNFDPNKSVTDTEAILHRYEELGVEAVARLRGMFSFAHW